MRRPRALGGLLWLVVAVPAFAHLGAPATFDLIETSPGAFRVTLTLPIVEGRVVKARPVFPDVCRVQSGPYLRAGPMSVTREWDVTCRPEELQGAAVGLAGLLGSAQEVTLTLETLDGRVYREQLKPTRTFFVVPPPLAPLGIAASSLREGVRHAARRPDLWILLFCLGVTVATLRRSVAAALLWGLGHALGSALARQLGWAFPGALAIAVAGAAGAAITVRRLRGTGAPSGSRGRLVLGAAACLGLLAGAAVSGATTPLGLSSAEARLASAVHAAGALLGAVWISAIVGVAFSGARPAGAGERKRAHTAAVYLAGILAAAVAIYHMVGFLVTVGPIWADALARIRSYLAAKFVAPFAGDWAMGVVRIPALSLVALLAAAALFPWRRSPGGRKPRLLFAGVLLLVAVLLLPWAGWRFRAPFYAGRAPSSAQGRRILEPLLTQIYLALNLVEEGEAYDRLAEQVTGELTTDLYLDSRRRLASGTRGGATVVVRDVAVTDVDDALPQVAAAREFTYPCRWVVTARVTHWQHSHDRRNIYEGDLTLVVEDDRWKLARFDLQTEEREIVPGSFASR